MAWIRVVDETDAEGDAAIHEPGCVVADFNFVNRLELGLGFELER